MLSKRVSRSSHQPCYSYDTTLSNEKNPTWYIKWTPLQVGLGIHIYNSTKCCIPQYDMRSPLRTQKKPNKKNNWEKQIHRSLMLNKLISPINAHEYILGLVILEFGYNDYMSCLPTISL
jgi:hypothetical protein